MLRQKLNTLAATLYDSNKELLSIKQPKLRRPFMADVNRLEQECTVVQTQLSAAIKAANPDIVVARLQAEAKDSSIKSLQCMLVRRMRGEIGARIAVWRDQLKAYERIAAQQREAIKEKAFAQAHQDWVGRLQAQKRADRAIQDLSAQKEEHERVVLQQAQERDALQAPIATLQQRGQNAAIKQLRGCLTRRVRGLLACCVFVWRNRSTPPRSVALHPVVTQ